MRGIFYKSPKLYQALTYLKLSREYPVRFQIAAAMIREGESVLDVCAGPGEFKAYLPEGCTYTAVDASAPFARYMARKHVPCLQLDLHQEEIPRDCRADVVVMLISLCQFRETSADALLENFKRLAKKVIIVEDTLVANSFQHPVRDYLLKTDYYRPIHLFRAEEFKTIMQRHHYDTYSFNHRYGVGTFERR